MVAARPATIEEMVAELERPLTEEDFWALPDDENRYEIIGGERFASPPPATTHQRVSTRLTSALFVAIENRGLGIVFSAPTAVKLSPIDFPQPDILVVRIERRNLVQEQAVLGAPDLVVEILSPSSRRRDLVKKRGLYQTAGVEEYWIVDPVKRTVEVFVLESGLYHSWPMAQGTVRSRVLPTVDFGYDRIFPSLQAAQAVTTPSTTG